MSINNFHFLNDKKFDLKINSSCVLFYFMIVPYVPYNNIKTSSE